MPRIKPLTLKQKNRNREHGDFVDIVDQNGDLFHLVHLDGYWCWRKLGRDFEWLDDGNVSNPNLNP